MSVKKEDVLKALSHVQEPDLKKDLVTLQMIKDVEVKDKNISFTVVLTTPACPLKEVIRQDCEAAIEEHIGPEYEMEIHMDADVSSIRPAGPVLPGVKNIIAVVSGKGGVGKSTVSTNLAMALSLQGAKVGLLDADISGPSIPTMLGMEKAKPMVTNENGKSILLPAKKHGIKVLSIGFLAEQTQAIVWRGPMMSSALRQFIQDANWGELDYMVVDMPPGTSDIALTLVQTVPVTGAVIVTTPQKVALADAQKALSMFRQPNINVPVLGVVENMAYFTPEELPDNKYYIFGHGGGKILARQNAVNYLGEIPIVMGIREGGDSGYPAVMTDEASGHAFKLLAKEVARQVSIRNAQAPETKPVDITVS